MKILLKVTVFVLSLAYSSSSLAQVGMVANNPDKSAVLDMRATSNQGLLIPNVNLKSTTDKTIITNPVQSLLVYNTNAAIIGDGAEGEGFYFWDTNRWVKLIATNDTIGWGLSGNGNVNSDVHFVGTTDSKDWIVKTNNTERLRVLAEGNIGIGTNAPINSLHVKSNSDPVRLEGLATSTDPSDITLVADGNGVVRKAKAGASYVAFLQSAVPQTYKITSFGASSATNSDPITFTNDEVKVNTIGSWDGSSVFTVNENGLYEVYASANFISVNGPDADLNISLELQQETGNGWQTVLGARTIYSKSWANLTISCPLGGIVSLTAGTKLKLVIHRMGGGIVTGGKVGADCGVHGVTFSKVLKLNKIG